MGTTAHDVTTAAYDVSATTASHVRGPRDDASSASDDGTTSYATTSSVPATATTAAAAAWSTTADSSARSAVSQSYRVLRKYLHEHTIKFDTPYRKFRVNGRIYV